MVRPGGSLRIKEKATLSRRQELLFELAFYSTKFVFQYLHSFHVTLILGLQYFFSQSMSYTRKSSFICAMNA